MRFHNAAFTAHAQTYRKCYHFLSPADEAKLSTVKPAISAETTVNTIEQRVKRRRDTSARPDSTLEGGASA
ncbi:hypothetical protein NQZ68_012700 [Dissostichus eleginoides]|nr:hypothetical protein NQZ68_032095 [Dissostichus eleginoides]KAI9534467.1 hypothetical protein NQZ68_012700 [Dissostichus eleginoides]